MAYLIGELSQSEIDRFWASVQKSSWCWIWIGRKHHKDETGKFRITRDGCRLELSAHRVAYTLINGKELPTDAMLERLCTEPSCVRPDHHSLASDRPVKTGDYAQRGIVARKNNLLGAPYIRRSK